MTACKNHNEVEIDCKECAEANGFFVFNEHDYEASDRCANCGALEAALPWLRLCAVRIKK